MDRAPAPRPPAASPLPPPPKLKKSMKAKMMMQKKKKRKKRKMEEAAASTPSGGGTPAVAMVGRHETSVSSPQLGRMAQLARLKAKAESKAQEPRELPKRHSLRKTKSNLALTRQIELVCGTEPAPGPAPGAMPGIFRAPDIEMPSTETLVPASGGKYRLAQVTGPMLAGSALVVLGIVWIILLTRQGNDLIALDCERMGYFGSFRPVEIIYSVCFVGCANLARKIDAFQHSLHKSHKQCHQPNK